jgi:RNA 2',3'-cyclic 3'-phosphodiesterase
MSEAGRVRLFVALELPDLVRDALVAWRPSGGLRLVDPIALHVTLCFLGWRFEREVPAILDACATVTGSPPGSLSLDQALWLPPRRPRVLAIRLTDEGARLAAAQANLSDALSSGGWYTPEARAFLAHVTVARVARDVRRARATELAPPPSLSFEGDRVTLYRSHLGSSGARYEPLGSVVLGSARGLE